MALYDASTNGLRSPSCLDPTVKRRKQDSFWIFDIMLTISDSQSVECVGYRIEKATGFIGRRTHIFVNNVNPTSLNGVAITVIKDQYRRPGHRFDEVEVLQHLHATACWLTLIELRFVIRRTRFA
jgi:hypothetical protein